MEYKNRMMTSAASNESNGELSGYGNCPECGAKRLHAPTLSTVHDGEQADVVYCSNPSAHGGKVKFWKRADLKAAHDLLAPKDDAPRAVSQKEKSEE